MASAVDQCQRILKEAHAMTSTEQPANCVVIEASKTFQLLARTSLAGTGTATAPNISYGIGGGAGGIVSKSRESYRSSRSRSWFKTKSRLGGLSVIIGYQPSAGARRMIVGTLYL